MTYKLVLIAPSQRKRNKGFSIMKSGLRMLTFPPLSLANIAALTPPDFTISLLDEKVEDINFNEHTDLVAITTLTASAPRAYYIADKFREKGTTVVLGGIHASALPNEAIQHANAVVIGEAEGVWQRLISDFKKGKLKKFYKNKTFPNIDNLPRAKRNLFKKNSYITINTIQITRGCPMNCDFCSVSKFFGATYRHRPVDDVINEIKELKNSKQPLSLNPINSFMSYVSNKANLIAFMDDNILGNPKYTEELLKKLIPLKINWGGQASIKIAQNEKLLELAAKSGCRLLFIGIESISNESLKRMGKLWNKNEDDVIKSYEKAIKKIHQYGIGIEGAFILGYDSDEESIFEKTIDFVERNQIELVQFTLPTPFPGTKLYERLEKENRILTKDWSKYDCTTVVFKPKSMSAAELQERYDKACKRIRSFKSIFKRVKRNKKIFLPINIFYNWAAKEYLKAEKN